MIWAAFALWLVPPLAPADEATSLSGDAIFEESPAANEVLRILGDADLALAVARERICGRVRRAREVAQLGGRIGGLVQRAEAAFGRFVQPLTLLEPSRGGPACERFRQPARAAMRSVDEAEALIASAEAGRQP